MMVIVVHADADFFFFFNSITGARITFPDLNLPLLPLLMRSSVCGWDHVSFREPSSEQT